MRLIDLICKQAAAAVLLIPYVNGKLVNNLGMRNMDFFEALPITCYYLLLMEHFV